ncbi:MAG: hypothetical protein DRI81_10815 [Chloroflexi bacterium]|nr:MAG: hypothetical protein DRI81_10815 [Chloroflexota bacterium]
MFKCDCIDPVFFHRRGRKARREGFFDYLCDLCALSGEMWVITSYLLVITHMSQVHPPDLGNGCGAAKVSVATVTKTARMPARRT